MKPMPVSPIDCATAAGGSMMLAPSASSTSALPDFDDTERPPCLATRAPAAAATNIDAVEMLNVADASPPVPTMSSRVAGSGASTLVANSRITCAAAAISPIVSFLTRMPTVSAAIITGVTSPRMISRMIASISSWKISRCSIVRCSASCTLMVIGPGPSVQREEVRAQCLAVLGQERLGVELHALDGEAAVAHAHDLAVGGARRDLEVDGHARALDRERMVAGRRERRRQPGEHAPSVVRDRRELAVHHLAGAHDRAAECFTDRLVAKAHAEDRQLPGEAPDQRHRHAGFGRRARTRRNDDALRREPLDLVERDRIVAMHAHVGAKLAEILDEVVGEAVVVVDHQQH